MYITCSYRPPLANCTGNRSWLLKVILRRKASQKKSCHVDSFLCNNGRDGSDNLWGFGGVCDGLSKVNLVTIPLKPRRRRILNGSLNASLELWRRGMRGTSQKFKVWCVHVGKDMCTVCTYHVHILSHTFISWGFVYLFVGLDQIGM